MFNILKILAEFNFNTRALHLLLFCNTINHFATISHWEQQSYGAGLYRSAEALAACFNHNPQGLMAVCDNNVLLGYADVWPLKQGFYSDLRLGLVFEESLNASVILPPRVPAAHFIFTLAA